MVDGDMQYDISQIKNYINYFLDKKLDMLNIARNVVDRDVHRKFHTFGNIILTGFVNMFFGNRFKDVLSGYKIFSRRFVKSFPAASRGFEIETELTVFALQMRLSIDEVEAKYFKRPEGSHSKLNTFKDGFRILFTIFYFVMIEKPFIFFSTISIILLGIFLSVYHFSNINKYLTIFLIILSFLSFFTGLIMNMIRKSIDENRRFKYNSIKKN